MPQSARIVFTKMERGRLRKPAAEAVDDQTRRLDASRVFLLASGILNRETPEVENVRKALGNRYAGAFDAMLPHTPRQCVIAAADQARDARADLIVHGSLSAWALPVDASWRESKPMSTAWKSPETAPKDGTPMLMIARAAHVRCSTPGLIIGFWSAENSNWATAPFDDGRGPIKLDVLYWAELELPSNIPLITNAVAERRSASSH